MLRDEPKDCSAVLLHPGPNRIRLIAQLRRLRHDLTVASIAGLVDSGAEITLGEHLPRSEAAHLVEYVVQCGATAEVRGPPPPPPPEPISSRPMDWLRRRTDFATAEAELDSEAAQSEWWREFKRAATPDSELWWFTSPDANWQALCGREGYALVAAGQITRWFLTAMN